MKTLRSSHNSDGTPVNPPDVPDTCLLGKDLARAISMSGGKDSDPCSRCNHDRTKCGGRARVPD